MNYRKLVEDALGVFGRIVLLALVVWREARGQAHACKLAVAYVAVARAEDPRKNWWGDDMLAVLFSPMQFSSVTDKKDGQLVLWPREGATWAECLRAAAAAYFHWEANPVPGATHYHSFPKQTPPKAWGAAEFLAKVDDIYFFKAA
jgi:hypothetical protein